MSKTENYTILNLTNFAAAYQIDPTIGYLTKEVARGENASLNLALVTPGTHEVHHHKVSDEIDYVISGQARMTIDGEVLLIKPGDLIYLPASTVHDFEAIGKENLQLLVIFAPPLKENDRIFV